MIGRRRAGLGRVGLLIASLGICMASAQAQEFRAFWVDVFNPGFKSNSQINTMISRAVNGNYNAIVMEVLAYHDRTGTGHGAYWNSSIVPKATDISGGIDPLAQVISLAQANDIEIHAWIVPFRLSSQTTWPPSGTTRLSADMLMVQDNNIGSITRVDNRFYALDPGNPDSQQYIIDIVNELSNNYDIDGINLDYIRYEVSDAGYPAVLNNPKSSLERFKSITGFVGTPSTSNSSWSNFRRRGISELVRRIYPTVHTANNPRQPLMLSADLIAFGNAPSNFTSTSSYQLYQDWLTWVNDGYLDAAMVMNYKREWSPPQDSWYRNWVNRSLSWVPADRHFYAGQGNYLNPKADSITQMAYALNQGADGVVNFSYAATADENENGTSESDASWYTFVRTNLFTQPADRPEMFWHDPNVSTEACVWGQVINETSGQPVDDAQVVVDGLLVRTDGNGFYARPRISTTSSGRSFNVSASGDGCTPQQFMTTAFPTDFIRIDFTLCPLATLTGDLDEDGDIDYDDLLRFIFCCRGDGQTYVPGNFCLLSDFDEDFDLDARDFAEFQIAYGAP